MILFRRMFLAAAAAGVLSGVFIGILHQFTTTEIIRQAEVFERAAAERGSDEAAHDDHGLGWEPGDGLERMSYTVLADALAGVGFCLILIAGYAIVNARMDCRSGFYWGIAGFVAVMVAPSLGLPPEVPGAAAAPLVERQIWWLGTAVVSSAALLLLYLRPANPLSYIAALAMVALPHAIGAPEPTDYHSAAPQWLQHRFVVATVLSDLAFWSVAGTLSGLLYQNLVQPVVLARSFIKSF
jgi:cobalt transporter subunit CbtA